MLGFITLISLLISLISRITSRKTAGLAVPVKAKRVGAPCASLEQILRRFRATFKYAVLKSCPHSEMQCASSSTAEFTMWLAANACIADLNSLLCKRSGDKKMNSAWPSAISAKASTLRAEVFKAAACIPCVRSIPSSFNLRI